MTKRKSKVKRKKEVPNQRILVISDLHAPYCHPDAVDFLRELDSLYDFDRVLSVGDEVDAHALSFHEHDADLYSAGHELEKAIETLQPLYEMFPKVDIVESNHGSLHMRKAKTHGIPQKYFRDYREILNAPPGWKWSPDLMLPLPDGNQLYVCHGKNKDPGKVAREYGTCTTNGHYHCEAVIKYVSTPSKLLWGLSVGCLIDRKSPAFAYARLNLARPIISVGMVIDSHPRLALMILDRHGRWSGKIG